MARNIGISATKEELQEMYWGKGMSFRGIGGVFGVSDGAVRKWFRRLGIARRPRGGGWMDGRHKIAPPPKETLEDLYVAKQMSLRAIGRMFRVGWTLVSTWLKENGIDRRAAKRTAQAFPDSDELISLYRGGKSIAALARHYKADKPTVRKWLQELGLSIRHKGAWKGIVFTPERVRNILKGLAMRPTKPESNLDQFLQEWLPGEWLYNGDGKHLVIGGKVPDFININGHKALIELFGDYWHKGENPEERAAIFGRYGFALRVIWEHELKDPESLKERIISFGNTLRRDKNVTSNPS